jgi:hypothetical protein
MRRRLGGFRFLQSEIHGNFVALLEGLDGRRREVQIEEALPLIALGVLELVREGTCYMSIWAISRWCVSVCGKGG